LSPVPESQVDDKGDETNRIVVTRKIQGAYLMNEFGQKGKVPLSERLSVSPEEASALTGIGLTSIREAISSGDLKAKKHGRRTIILPDDLRVWLKMLPDAGKPIEESPA
jgi:hypothetical protein